MVTLYFIYFSISLARMFINGILTLNRELETPVKMNILLWRASMNSIPTRGKLSSRGITLDSIICLICSDVVESIDHLFLGCEELAVIWSRVAVWWKCNLVSIQSLLTWVYSIKLFGGNHKPFHDVVMTVLWFIWNFRNSSFLERLLLENSLFFMRLLIGLIFGF